MQKILSDSALNNPETCLCNSCWTNLETFHEFHQFVAANYEPANFETREDKFNIQNNSDIIYDEDAAKDDQDHEMIKVEIVHDPDNDEAEWILENVEEIEEPKKPKVLSIHSPRTLKPTSIILDSADDQRIRETAKMACDICGEALDSLRDAKSHYKNAHAAEGYIVCCER